MGDAQAVAPTHPPLPPNAADGGGALALAAPLPYPAPHPSVLTAWCKHGRVGNVNCQSMCCELQPERIWTHRGVPEWWAAKAGAVYDDYVRRWQRGDVGNTSKLDGTLVIADDIGKYR
jgi:hypothetical protein